ncbi:hypothetical protein K490DRAFT_14505, partial [Saccharata proteae CBS 121410]
MPRFVVPKRSGAHRVASIALYRALLSQCSRVPLPEEARTVLGNITRNKFRRNRDLNSTRLLKYAFIAGYKTLSLLDNAVAGDAGSTSRIAQLLAATPDHLRRSPKKTGPKKNRAQSKEACRPPDRKELDARPRPLEELSGVRHVPKIYSANMIPVLRFSKPQPRSISRIINNKVDQRQRRIDLIDELQNHGFEMGSWEDDWDDLLEEMHGVPNEDDERGEGWTYEMRASVKTLYADIRSAKEQNRRFAKKMQTIIDQETALAEEE